MDGHDNATQQEVLLRTYRLRSSQYNLSICYDKQKEMLLYMRIKAKIKILRGFSVGITDGEAL
jgi:hypothetical protein